jgi:putative phosphoribosyl transferase
MKQFNQEVQLTTGDRQLAGDLTIPPDAKALIVFAHGSGSSRFSKRNREVAAFLQSHRYATLLFDLLTEAEDVFYPNRFDIRLLSGRLILATQWLEQQQLTAPLKKGFFGASTGAAAALQATVAAPGIFAVVSRGGRPDLAMDVLPSVTTPVLLIVGSADEDVLLLNQQAYQELSCIKKLITIEGATHLFEEPGAMEQVSLAACNWFDQNLNPPA